MLVLDLIFAVLAGTLTGLLSGWGLGGGTLLLLYLTLAAGVEQPAAQGINLLYFLPCSAAALVSHLRGGLVEKRCVLYAALAGVPVSLGAAFLATQLDTALLRKIFGGFLLTVGLAELLRKG